MASKGLGMGLGSLLGDTSIESENSDTRFLPIAKVEPRRNQPRKYFDEAALAELSASISEYGVIQPLTVREIKGGRYEIIAGERRWRAARLAGLTEIPARVIEADDKKTMELALVENLQREDLNPVEEGEGYKVLIEEYGLTQEEAASRVGKARPTVANALRILALAPPALEMLRSGKISSGHARALLQIKDESKQTALAEKIAAEGLSVRQAEAQAKRISSGKTEKEPKEDPEKIYVQDVERRLTKQLGRKVSIVRGKSKGRFEIEYYGSDDLELVIDALEKLKIDKGGRK